MNLASYKHVVVVNTRVNDEEFTGPFVDEVQKHGVAVSVVDLGRLGFLYEPSGAITIFNGSEPLPLTSDDFVYMRRTKGDRELGNVLAWVLDSIGVTFNDKEAQLHHLIANSKICQSFRLREIVSSPKTWVVGLNGFQTQRQMILKSLGYPLVLKVDGANGELVWKIDDEDMLNKRLAVIGQNRLKNESLTLLFQELIPNTFDIRVIVYQGQVLSAISRSAGAGEFHNNISKGGTAASLELTDDERRIAVEVTHKLGLDLGGVDLVRTADGVRLFEVNKSPGLVNKIVGDSNVRKIVRKLLAG